MTRHLVVVGASLAGLRAVEAARSDGFEGRITLIGAEPHLPYDRPPLSKAYLDETADSQAPGIDGVPLRVRPARRPECRPTPRRSRNRPRHHRAQRHPRRRAGGALRRAGDRDGCRCAHSAGHRCARWGAYPANGGRCDRRACSARRRCPYGRDRCRLHRVRGCIECSQAWVVAGRDRGTPDSSRSGGRARDGRCPRVVAYPQRHRPAMRCWSGIDRG